MPKTMILALGGVRSGKSAWAEDCALTLTPTPYYCATAIAGDAEMAARIERHREARDDGFTTIEEPHDIAGAIRARKAGEVMLVDSLGTWLTNMMMRKESDIAAACDELLAAVAAREAGLILVSEEVGLGVLPANALAREFADNLGSLNRRMAERADTVVMLAAGIPLALKGVMP